MTDQEIIDTLAPDAFSNYDLVRVVASATAKQRSLALVRALGLEEQ